MKVIWIVSMAGLLVAACTKQESPTPAASPPAATAPQIVVAKLAEPQDAGPHFADFKQALAAYPKPLDEDPNGLVRQNKSTLQLQEEKRVREEQEGAWRKQVTGASVNLTMHLVDVIDSDGSIAVSMDYRHTLVEGWPDCPRVDFLFYGQVEKSQLDFWKKQQTGWSYIVTGVVKSANFRSPDHVAIVLEKPVFFR